MTTTKTRTNDFCQCEKATAQQNQPMTADIVHQAIKCMKQAGITTITIDFGHTLVDVHTGGTFYGDADELCRHVRPVFRALLPALVQHPDLQVAIVTFSPQKLLVRYVVESIVGSECIDSIEIRGGSAFYFVGHGAWPVGKQAHIASLPNLTHALLIDDSLYNIAVAKLSGTQAIYFDPDEPDTLLEDIVHILSD